MAARFIVGIDLGTTNTACAFVDTAAGRALRVFEVPQLVAPGEMGARPTLPSFLYLAGVHELPAGSLDPPWTTGRAWCVGLLAREQGARVPGRDRKSTRLNSSHSQISYAVFCLKKKKKKNNSILSEDRKKKQQR